jgi:hypothetical protein
VTLKSACGALRIAILLQIFFGCPIQAWFWLEWELLPSKVFRCGSTGTEAHIQGKQIGAELRLRAALELFEK